MGLKFGNKQDLESLLEEQEETDSHKFLEYLAVCHSVVIDRNSGEFNSASPDELALLSGAKKLGFEFLGKQKDLVTISTPKGI